MHYKFFTLFLFLSILLIFTNCEVINPDEPIPSYIEIKEFSLSHEETLGIPDAWVYINGDLEGVFELPAKFPVIAEGESTISILPGIKVNGVNAQRSYYPFYKAYETNLKLEQTNTHILNPTSGYVDWSKVSFREDFESNNSFIAAEDSDTNFVLYGAEKFQGAQSGAIFLDTANNYFEVYTELIDKPYLAGSPGMFLELNFKTDNYVVVGLYFESEQYFERKTLLTLAHKDEWQKIYIDLYNPMVSLVEGIQYKVFFAGLLEDEKMNATILIDNIKIVESQY